MTTGIDAGDVVCLGTRANGCTCLPCKQDVMEPGGFRLVEVPYDVHGTNDGWMLWYCKCSACQEAKKEHSRTRARAGQRTYRELPIPPLVEDEE